MTNRVKGKLIQGGAVGISAGTPLVATLTQFPVWVEQSAAATISGLFLVFALLAIIPAMRYFRGKNRSPSSWLMWTVFFAIISGINSIIDQVMVIAFFGMIANIAGALLYKLGSKISTKDEEGEQADAGT